MTFSGSGGTLQIDGTALPANTISGLMPGDLIDLAGVAFNSTASIKLTAGNVLQVNDSGTLYSLNPRSRAKTFPATASSFRPMPAAAR